jgi:predicted dehydrogenase
VIGCGAVVEIYHGPTLKTLSDAHLIRVDLLIDYDPSRLACVGQQFPDARQARELAGKDFEDIDLAIIASPPRWHEQQCLQLLHWGIHVFCEKPMAAHAQEATRMVAASQKSGRLLSVGFFRRFFPSAEWIGDLIEKQPLGAPRSFTWSEGGVFDWPAASASFFQKNSSSGGVLADAGSHIFDLLLSWFSTPLNYEYYDDAMGGLEANALIKLTFPQGVTGTVRLSRDTPIPNRTHIHFERGTVSFSGASARDVVINLNGCRSVASSTLCLPSTTPKANTGRPTRSYHQAFVAQITNFIMAIRGHEPLRVTGEDAQRVQALIEQCYASRQPLELPWLSLSEISGISPLNPSAIPS